ncbi:MAG: glycosyltransferase family 4 protein [Planctomycetes bacterium]|nr:glycosyltransferase family 4 protein [Planctomycetota bacterium]
MHVVLDARLARHSGIGRYIRNLVRALPEAAPDVSLTLAANPSQDLSWAPRNVRQSRFPREVPIYSVSEQTLLPGWLSEIGGDLLHVPHFNVPLLFRGPVVVTLHDLIYLRFPREAGTLRRMAASVLIRLAARRARRVIAVSEATRDDLAATLGVDPARVEVIHHGAGLSYGEAPPPAGQRPLGEPYVLFVGTHAPHKNLGILLDAFVQVSRDDPRARLVLAGPEGRSTTALRFAIAKRGLAEKTRLALDCDDAALASWYAHACALALPSLCEGFGFPVLEAFGYGTPVVCARASALPEVAGDAAQYFAPDDPSALAAILARLLRDGKERAAWAARGVERLKAFDWRRTAERTAAVYREAATR